MPKKHNVILQAPHFESQVSNAKPVRTRKSPLTLGETLSLSALRLRKGSTSSWRNQPLRFHEQWKTIRFKLPLHYKFWMIPFKQVLPSSTEPLARSSARPGRDPFQSRHRLARSWHNICTFFLLSLIPGKLKFNHYITKSLFNRLKNKAAKLANR